MDDVPAGERPEQDLGLAHPKLVQRVSLIGGGAAQNGVLVHAGGMGAVGQADRLLRRHQHFELVGHHHVGGVRAAQMVAFQLVVFAVDVQVEQQRRQRGNAGTLADAADGGVDVAQALAHGGQRVDQRQAAVVVEVAFQRGARVAAAEGPHALGHHGRGGHAHRIGHAQPVDQRRDLVIHAKQVVQAGAEGVLAGEAHDQVRMVAAHIFQQRAGSGRQVVQVAAVVELARLGRGAEIEVETVGPGGDGRFHVARVAAHVGQQEGIALLRHQRVAHGAQGAEVVALLRADHRRKQLHKLNAVDDQRPQDLFLVGAGEKILVVVVEQGGLLALAQR